MHQCLVLEHNNWFLDAERLKRIDENKLRRVSEDQRQCLCELDFMTQNIDVVTGNINRRIVNLDKDRYIEISSELVNKAISLHQRKKQEKFLWFTVQNNSAKGFIKSNLELLDLIFFNLMSNAIKYSYPGTNIIIGVDDTDNYVRPHIISLTDFGTAVKADTQEQVFQMYFRGNEPTYTEGSGIGLYVAHTVSEILDAKLSWSSKKISEYNVPIMMRYLSLPSDLQKTLNVDFENIQVAFEQLINSSQITRIFNQEYLEYPKQWNSHEIQGEIMRPTYEVKFMIEI